MLEHARQFIERVLPWPGDGPGFVNLHWGELSNTGKGKFWGGRPHKTPEKFIRDLEYFSRQGQKDFYVCMSLQAKSETKVSQRGTSYEVAARRSEDALLLKSLYVDVDVKDGAYATTEEAIAALQAFIAATELPMPTAVVASGSGGFHAHWIMDRALTPAEWQPLAFALARAIQAHGLIADTQCTVDAARILRLPNTLNHKTTPPKNVELLALADEDISVELMQQKLQPYAGDAPDTFAGNLPMGPGAGDVNDDLGANVETHKHDILIADVAKHCAFIARSLGTGGKDNRQPAWFLTASIASFVVDSRAVFHDLSRGHPDYTVEATDSIFDRVSNNQKARNLGWTSCEKVALSGAKECLTCPLRAQKKSPLHFAAEEARTKADDNLPDKYVRNQAGLVCRKEVDEQGTVTNKPISEYPMTQGWLSNDPWTLHFTTRTDVGRRTVLDVPCEVITAKDTLGKYLGAKGFFCNDVQAKIMKEFLLSWIQKLQKQKDSVISAAPFGWSVVDGKIEGFTYGGRVWMNGDDRPAASPNPVLSYQYTPKGNKDVWDEAVKIIYEQDRPGLNAILATAFAGPLVRFTGFHGLIMNSYSSESGIGKTTSMKISQAVWGNPAIAMQGLNDTTNSVLGKMGQIKSLPMYWDELKSELQVKRFCSIVFDLTGGREKTRMNADATLRMSGTWQTMMVSASNDSLIDAMAKEVGSTTAGLHRLFEYIIPPPPSVSRDVGSVQRLLAKLDDNYGHAGLAYAKFLGRFHERIADEVAAMQDELNSEVKVKQEERNWTATMAVVLKGAAYANELGLMDINLVTLKVFLLDVLARMRGEVEKSPSDLNNNMSVASMLGEFLNMHRAKNTLITNRVWVSKGKPPKGQILVKCDTSKLDVILVQKGQEDGLVRISSRAISEFTAKRNYSRQTFVKKLQEEFGVKIVNGKLGSGTDLSCAMEYLLELDLNHPELSKYIE